MSNLLKRFGGYSAVAGTTFLLDLFLLNLLTQNGFSEYVSVVTAFLIAVSVNYYFSYTFVFTGTSRSLKQGYVFFLGIAVFGLLVIGPLTVFINNQFEVGIVMARILVAGFSGTTNFLLNNFFNFKMGLR